MQEEKEALSAHFQGLKTRMNKFRDIQVGDNPQKLGELDRLILF